MSEQKPKRLAVKLKPAAEKAVKQGHPWVFDKGIAKVNKEASSGDIAVIFDQKKNKFLALGLWDAASPIRIKILHQGSPTQLDSEFFKQKIDQAFQVRQPLLKTATNSYRFIYGENDGLPGLVADVYAKVLVVKVYSLIWERYLDLIVDGLQACAACTTVVLRLSRNVQNHPQKPATWADGLVIRGALENPQIQFQEHGLYFQANVVHGHKTGYFLDHRHNRKKIGEIAEGKTVLDVFSYAGGFSVHALAGGAASVMSIDVSKQALDAAAENARLNIENPAHETWAVDAFEGLRILKKQGRTFDIVIIDPPSFAKQASEVPTATKTYQQLIELAIPLVGKDGILLSASCSSRVDRNTFFEINERCLLASGRSWKLLEQTFHDIDHPIGFPEGAYLKSAYFIVN